MATGHGLAGMIGCFLLGFFADKGTNPFILYAGVFFGGGGLLLGMIKITFELRLFSR